MYPLLVRGLGRCRHFGTGLHTLGPDASRARPGFPCRTNDAAGQTRTNPGRIGFLRETTNDPIVRCAKCTQDRQDPIASGLRPLPQSRPGPYPRRSGRRSCAVQAGSEPGGGRDFWVGQVVPSAVARLQ